MLYLVQATAVFSIFYLVYAVCLRKLTFHGMNRLVLLLVLPIASILPLLAIIAPSLTSKIIAVPLFDQLSSETMKLPLQLVAQPLVESSIDYITILSVIYWLVFSIFIIRLLITAKNVFVLRKNAIIKEKDGYQLVFTDVSETFSYFNWIFIPREKFETLDLEILEHEKVHVRFKHSWDVLLAEVYIAFFWFNPLLYFYRKSLKSIHEFQADTAVLQSGVKISQYMKVLLQSMKVYKPNNLYNYFNQPILKKRVSMMTKPSSNRFAKLIYLLLVPICVCLVSAFTAPTMVHQEYLQLLDVSVPQPNTPALFPIKNGTKEDITAKFGSVGTHKLNKGRFHGGIDIRAKIGIPVLATADGVISKASMEGDWGNLIIITHAEGYETWYAHLDRFETFKNKAIKKGDVIGYVGNSGKSTGPHLHYEVRKNGKRKNPLDYLK